MYILVEKTHTFSNLIFWFIEQVYNFSLREKNVNE